MVIIRIAWTRRGIKKFENEVNKYIQEGYILEDIIISGRLRLVLVAQFIKR